MVEVIVVGPEGVGEVAGVVWNDCDEDCCADSLDVLLDSMTSLTSANARATFVPTIGEGAGRAGGAGGEEETVAALGTGEEERDEEGEVGTLILSGNAIRLR